MVSSLTHGVQRRPFAPARRLKRAAQVLPLDDPALGVDPHTDDVETISTSGADPVNEIFHVLQRQPVTRVIVPASLPGLEAVGFSKLLRMCPVPVVVAPRVKEGGPDSTFPIAS